MTAESAPSNIDALRWLRPIVGGMLLATFLLAFVRTAWVCDDAFITFRVVDNALHGLGLTWNPGERVQVYTHPLWFGLLVPGVAIIGDPYVVSITLSAVLLLMTILVLGRSIGEWRVPSIVVIASLLWSRSFIDYSSSGLENPLTHALLACYLWTWIALDGARRRSLALTGIASALFLTRPDAVVVIAPSLAAHCWKHRREMRQHVAPILLGGLPAVAWVAFSLFYYGAPVPNTALAKTTGLGWRQNALQAWEYVKWTLENDFVTAGLMVAGIAFGFVGRERALRPIAMGLALWMGYLILVGADYMGGRFFSAPALLAAGVLALEARRWSSIVPTLVVAALLLVNSRVLGTTVFSPAAFDRHTISAAGIADERGFYYQGLGFVPTLGRGTWFAHPWLLEGSAIAAHPGWYTRCTIGMAAYAAGAGVRWLDPLALADPLLARLPPRTDSRVGHYERAFPEGYIESVLVGANVVRDPALHTLYRDIDLVARAPVFASGRVGAIWRLNTGHHAVAAAKFDREAIGLPGVAVQARSPMSCFGIPYGGDGTWKLVGPPPKALRVVFHAGS